MKEYKKTKRTHFPHFSIKNQRHQNLYTCIRAYLYTCFVKTNPFGLEAGSWPLEAVFAKRTHFALDSSLWSLVFFTKRTHLASNTGCLFICQLSIVNCQFRRIAATKRTHFQCSRSIPASDKSLCRLSAFLIILESLGSWVLKFLVFAKRTHFSVSLDFRAENAILWSNR
jgi:hypothetical protein